eukprot:340533_1
MAYTLIITLILIFSMDFFNIMKGEIIKCDGSCNCDNEISGETCRLNCLGKHQCQDSELKCRSDDPCIIICYGENSCSGNTHIIATSSTNVNLICIGKNACKGNTQFYCGTGKCDITCEQHTSCENMFIHSEKASEFACSPSSYCIKPKSRLIGLTDSIPISNPTASMPTSILHTSYPTKIPSQMSMEIPIDYSNDSTQNGKWIDAKFVSTLTDLTTENNEGNTEDFIANIVTNRKELTIIIVIGLLGTFLIIASWHWFKQESRIYEINTN